MISRDEETRSVGQPTSLTSVRDIERLGPTSPEALFRQSYRPIVQSLSLAHGDQAVVEDAVQEAFVQVCNKWNRIARYDDPAAWVRRVAINNKLRNAHRSTSRRSAAALRLVAEHRDVQPPTEPATELMAALEALAPRQRLAAVLYYVDDLSTAEVADAMEVSEGSVSQHLNRARAALRTHMEEAR